MAKRFIVSTSPVGRNTENKIRKYFERMKADWWHWIENTWLVVTKEDILSRDLQSDLAEIIRDADFFVLNITGSGDFSGRFDADEADNVTQWITTNWAGKFAQ